MGTSVVPASGRKRLLSIDGGGLLGLIPAEALIEVERQLDVITGTHAPLCDRFDLIGGTSTGAILAAGLAMGLSATKLRDFYLEYGKEIFTKSFFLVRLWHSYPSGPLEKHLKEVLGEDTRLGDPARLRTQLMIVSKNATQGTTWFFTNNPRGKYFEANKNLRLWQVVRASTAAPTYFPPQTINVSVSGKTQDNEFVDGGVSTYNNPSLQLFLEATDPAYKMDFPVGPDKLLLLSLGTGFNSTAVAPGGASHFNVLDWARYAIKELMGDANLQQNVLMHLIGEKPQGDVSSTPTSPDAPSADSLNALGLGAKKLLTYQRITIGLTDERLQKLGLSGIDPIKVREMDAADQIPNMQRIGQAVAREQVKMEALKQFFI